MTFLIKPYFTNGVKANINPAKRVKYPAAEKSITEPLMNTQKKSFHPSAIVLVKLDNRKIILNRIK